MICACGPRRAQEATKAPQVASRDLPGGRLGPSRGLKTAPRRLKTGLRRPQGSPETAEELPGRPQTGPRAAQDGPTNSPRQAQMCSTTSLKRGVVEQNAPQNSSRAPQGPSGRCFGAVLFHHSSLKRGCGTTLGLRGCSGCCFGAVLFHLSCLTESCGAPLHGTTTALLRRHGGGVCLRQLDIYIYIYIYIYVYVYKYMDT